MWLLMTKLFWKKNLDKIVARNFMWRETLFREFLILKNKKNGLSL
jgi:hypothetical protein